MSLSETRISDRSINDLLEYQSYVLGILQSPRAEPGGSSTVLSFLLPLLKTLDFRNDQLRDETFPRWETVSRWTPWQLGERQAGELSLGGKAQGWKRDSSSSVIRVDVAAEDDDVGPPAWLVSSSEEEGAQEASYAQRRPLLAILGGVLAENRP